MRLFNLVGALGLGVGVVGLMACSAHEPGGAVVSDTNATEPGASEKKDDEQGGGRVDLPTEMPPVVTNADRMCPAAQPNMTAALAIMWSDGVPPAGTKADSRSVARADGCMVRLGIAASASSAGESRWTIFLEKRDLSDTEATCAQPKGYRALAETFAEPHAILTSHLVDQKLFAVAYDLKPSATAPVEMHMAQYDWDTGDVLREAVMAVEGHTANAPPVGAPFALNANDCDLTLYGDGTFPGAVGTNVGVWKATYPGFFGREPQLPAYASRATYE